MDSDGDDEISFSDFFTNLLPYLIYSETKSTTAQNQQRQSKSRGSSENTQLLNIKVRSVSGRQKKAKELGLKRIDANLQEQSFQ